MTLTPAITAAVAERLAAQGLRVTSGQAEKLAVYLDVLAAWNRRVNLVGPSDWTVVLDELVADSPHLAAFLDSPEVAGLLGSAGGEPLCLDFGAGAGLPGIPLRIVWPRGDYALIEVRAKRAAFLAEALARLDLPRTTVFSGRAEDAPARLAPPDRPGMVVCLSRAFLPWPKFLAFAAGHVGPLGRAYVVLAMTTERPADAPGEINDAGFAVVAEKAYRVAGKDRYFSLFMPIMAPKDPLKINLVAVSSANSARSMSFSR
ncbi:MAG: 16S rRNA (guanine(527)-N(7))-methyltransferase RsmG [Desulfovibrio sp.]|nr:16S rRNA (guanine(527)-N(7))-methyltransferase RsmG [Desulfovibrio sp.]